MKQVELLSPAGTLKHMHYAFAYGADAVYAGQPRYSLRVRNNDFNKLEQLAQGINTAHEAGKLFYVAANISPHNSKLRTFLDDIREVIELKPDALIMADPGLIMMVRENWPDMPVHLSVQTNTVNYAAVKFWKSLGLTRIILSRELSLEEVEEIRQECPDIELEVFVHGALCIAYSGRCLLSGYMNHRDPNQGTCTNACRWDYKAHPATADESGDLRVAQPETWKPEPQLGSGESTEEVFLLEESSRPGILMPAMEDEHGTYIMNSKDLRAVQHVEKLVKIGIDCLKIEGRTKSHYYVARTAQVYRQAIDAALRGESFNMDWMNELESLANRGYTEGFYRRHVHDEYQNYERGVSKSDQQQFVGEVCATDANGWLEVDVKNHFECGDELELMRPEGNLRFQLTEMRDAQGETTEVAKGSGHLVRIRIPDIDKAEKGLLLKQL